MATRSSPAKTNPALDPALPQKKRARRRLVGAAALALAAAIVLPLVLDSEPRQARDDIQVSIPSRDTPLNERESSAPHATGSITPYDTRGAEGAARESPSTEAQARAGAADDNREDAGSASQPEARAEAAAEPQPAGKPEPQPALKPEAKVEPKVEAKPAAKVEAKPAAKAEARSEARPAPDTKPVAHLLQAGAFATEKAAHDQLERVRKLGVKTYTEKVKTPQGERIRVRIGPFATREAAERARAKLKAAGIESAPVAH